MLFNYYSSVEKMLKDIYPAFDWQSSKFDEAGRRHPPRYFANINHQRELLDRIGTELNIQKVPLNDSLYELVFNHCRWRTGRLYLGKTSFRGVEQVCLHIMQLWIKPSRQ